MIEEAYASGISEMTFEEIELLSMYRAMTEIGRTTAVQQVQQLCKLFKAPDRGYTAKDAQVYGADNGPACLGLPNPKVPFRGIPNFNFADSKGNNYGDAINAANPVIGPSINPTRANNCAAPGFAMANDSASTCQTDYVQFIDLIPAAIAGVNATILEGGIAAQPVFVIPPATTRQHTNVPIGLELSYMGVLLEWTDDFDIQDQPTLLRSWQPMFQSVPVSVNLWKNQGTSFGLPGYKHIPYLLLAFNKGLLYFIMARCDDAEFQMYLSDCEIPVGAWQREEPYLRARDIAAAIGIGEG